MYNNVTLRRQHKRRRFVKIGMMKTSKTLMTALLLILSVLASASTLSETEINNLNTIAGKQTKLEFRQYPFNSFTVNPLQQIPSSLPGCPLCDSSVYSYCSHKLIRDSCCCEFEGAAIYQKSPQCAFYNCALLYAKSCYEYSLIKNCCCNNPY